LQLSPVSAALGAVFPIAAASASADSVTTNDRFDMT